MIDEQNITQIKKIIVFQCNFNSYGILNFGVLVNYKKYEANNTFEFLIYIKLIHCKKKLT